MIISIRAILIFLIISASSINVFTQNSTDITASSTYKEFTISVGNQEQKVVIGQQIRVWRKNHPIIKGYFKELEGDQIIVYLDEKGINLKIKISDITRIKVLSSIYSVHNNPIIIKSRYNNTTRYIKSGQLIRVWSKNHPPILGHYNTKDKHQIVVTKTKPKVDISIRIDDITKIVTIGKAEAYAGGILLQAAGITVMGLGFIVTAITIEGEVDGAPEADALLLSIPLIAAGYGIAKGGKKMHTRKYRFKPGKRWFIVQ